MGKIESNNQNSPPGKISGSKPVMMRLRPGTIEAIDRICEAADTDNRTLAVSQAVKLVDWIIQQQNEGAVLFLESSKGEKTRVVPVGL